MSQPIELDPKQLRLLIGAMREGYEAGMPEITNDLHRGYAAGWQGAMDALERIAAMYEPAHDGGSAVGL